MNILFICHRFPYPPKHGGNIRSFNTIRHLSQNHRVTVATLARNSDELTEGEGIKGYCERLLVGRVNERIQNLRMIHRLATRAPSSMGYFYSQTLAQQIEATLAAERYDLIFIHSSSVAQYVSHREDIPKILDFCDMDSQKWLIYSKIRPFPLNWGYWLEGTKLAADEKRLAKRFDLCTCATVEECHTLESYHTGTAVDWFPNGVDHQFFTPADEAYDPDLLSFIGRMDYYPNQECMERFCHRVLPLIQQRRPQAKLVIVGADPTPAVRRLADLPGVTVTGSVADVRPYIRRSAAMVAPLTIARGTQNKILEALAMAVPVLTSSLAARGVHLDIGTHLLAADEPSEIAAQALRLMEDRPLRQQLAQQGRAGVLERHDWHQSMQRLDAILARCTDLFNHRQAA